MTWPRRIVCENIASIDWCVIPHRTIALGIAQDKAAFEICIGKRRSQYKRFYDCDDAVFSSSLTSISCSHYSDLFIVSKVDILYLVYE